MNASIQRVWFLVKVPINSFVGVACFSIVLALNCFAVSLFCLFMHAYSTEMKVLMFAHILSLVGLFSHLGTAALKWFLFLR
jgi:hypothetical protein